MKKPIYSIGSKIYSRIYEGGEGIIVDISYSYKKDENMYLISMGFDKPEVWAIEMEMSEEKTVI